MLVAQHTVYFPDAFLTQMREAMPSTLSFDDFLAACQRPLRRSIRVNTLKTSVADFLQLTAPYGWTLTPIPWCEEGFWIERDNEDALPLGSTAEHLSGLFYIQEASSMLPVAALFADGNAPQRVMDVAAAPGSKTTQIAARMNNEGAILANEFSASRVKVLHANISRCGISNVALTHFDGRVFGAAVPEMFDAILLDAPCSGEGVVRKDPDALKNWSPESNQEIAATQRELIDSAFHALRPGGTLVYSTCTLNREENEAVCLWLKETYPDAVEFLPLGDLFPGSNKALTEEGCRLVSGGTDNHLILIDLQNMSVTGKDLEKRLDAVYITANKNASPNDPQSAFVTSGLRVGTPAVTTRGFKEEDMVKVAHFIKLAATDFDAKADEIRAGVTELCNKYPIYE